ncbi:MAG TPA: hypothetical protein VIJ51_17020 [Solirubrobacteraceae bacterium]
MTRPTFEAARILVIDDDPANVMLLERLLEGWGYHDIVATTDSTQALELCIGCSRI